ncbi:MAG: restriction endonuclease subunit S [Treponema sp.]|uniref:restriction endonuclease subunit S n=1 Tax=Treponema sp. TaxID=166 RepID=UPI00298D61B3|nr:restriction endonuclease subunit S [Treponema sp.]MBR5933486.1 restriction endonuclease subunit S [Treponema sp.]
MTAKDLKNALLQEAVQGKLVPQIASEGNAKDLLEEIKKEKDKLIKEGKLKKEKPFPEITEDEIPFDIPENWCWCRLGDFANVVTGSLDANAQDPKGDYAFFTCGVEVFKTKTYAFDCDAILLGGNNASGDYKMHRYKGKFNAYQRVYVISGAKEEILNYFEYVIKYWLPHLKKNSQGTTTRFIKLSQVTGMLVPLPPFEEQKRIVAAIEQFMPLIEEYGKKEVELTALNADIAKTLKNAILQEAVQGKLAPQIASDGNAKDLLEEIKKEKAKLIKEGKLKKEKPLPEITEDEIPFDIPENWCWCRLGEIVDTNIGLTYSPSDVVEKDGICVLRSNNIQNGKIVYEDLVHVNKKVSEKCLANKGDLLICARNGSRALVGKCALIEEDGMAFGAFMAIVRSRFTPYIRYFINSPVYRAKLEGVNTTTINQITQDNLRETLIPLPPFEEQKRIVKTIEKLMPLCEKLGG